MNTGPDMYECMCPEEFEGMNCELVRTDECDPDPCENGATCMVSVSPLWFCMPFSLLCMTL